MSEFTRFDAPLNVVYDHEYSLLTGKDFWLVAKPFNYYVGAEPSTKWVNVPEGFRTDGATVPRFLWSFLPPWGLYGQAAVLHDFLCTNKFITVNNKYTSITVDEADSIFFNAMGVLEVPLYKRAIIYVGIRLYRRFASRLATVS